MITWSFPPLPERRKGGLIKKELKHRNAATKGQRPGKNRGFGSSNKRKHQKAKIREKKIRKIERKKVVIFESYRSKRGEGGTAGRGGGTT